MFKQVRSNETNCKNSIVISDSDEDDPVINIINRRDIFVSNLQTDNQVHEISDSDSDIECINDNVREGCRAISNLPHNDELQVISDNEYDIDNSREQGNNQNNGGHSDNSFRQNAFATIDGNVNESWKPCKVIEVTKTPVDNKYFYKVIFNCERDKRIRTLSGKDIANFSPPTSKLDIGLRVLAMWQPDTINMFFPGVIVERASDYNDNRYLIFFENGNVQYTYTEHIRCLFSVSRNVWNDVTPHFASYIKRYLQQNPNFRPSINVQIGDTLIAKSKNGKWFDAKVIDIDHSILLMLFDDKHTEWLHKASPRFEFIHQHELNRLPSVCPKISLAESSLTVEQNSESDRDEQDASVLHGSTVTVAAIEPDSESVIEKDLIDCVPPQSFITFSKYSKCESLIKFTPHTCNVNCGIFEIKVPMLHLEGMLMHPILCGYTRKIYSTPSYSSYVVYRTPCGRRVQTIRKMHQYLKITKSSLNVDNFSFDVRVSPVIKYELNSKYIKIPDITNGLEPVPIPCVNTFNDLLPKPFQYSSHRIPTETVPLIIDADLMSCCDCDDDCVDVEKCACRKLSRSSPIQNVNDYTGKRLNKVVKSGLFECNSRCKCNSSCLNRVVQYPPNKMLCVFNTNLCGWGVRSLEDIQEGTFICVYSGEILDEKSANERGLSYSDEYFADLDFLEVASKMKEGYEENVLSDHEIEANTNDVRNGNLNANVCNKRNMRLRSDTFNSNAPIKPMKLKKRKNIKNISCLNGDGLYVVDGMRISNIGRYINHSCNPNLIVQNVFVDTHDLRFPWVAFFTSKFVPAGTELTWNYNYHVGSVKGKQLYCHCGSGRCQRRLL